jgi:hypothetical protein
MMLTNKPTVVVRGCRNADGLTALMWCSRYGHAGVATSLLDRGAGPSEADNQGNTSLMEVRPGGISAQCPLPRVTTNSLSRNKPSGAQG